MNLLARRELSILFQSTTDRVAEKNWRVEEILRLKRRRKLKRAAFVSPQQHSTAQHTVSVDNCHWIGVFEWVTGAIVKHSWCCSKVNGRTTFPFDRSLRPSCQSPSLSLSCSISPMCSLSLSPIDWHFVGAWSEQNHSFVFCVTLH